MRKKALSRYLRTDENKIIIEIAAEKIENLYDNFDKYAPNVRKELDQGLVEYLIDSVSEIGNEKFVVKFRLSVLTDEELIERVKLSIHNYFLYLIEREKRELTIMSRTSLIYFLIGISILSLSIWVDQTLIADEAFIYHVLTEGLNVAAWVLLWHAIATFFINWTPHHRVIKLYTRITQAKIYFEFLPVSNK